MNKLFNELEKKLASLLMINGLVPTYDNGDIKKIKIDYLAID